MQHTAMVVTDSCSLCERPMRRDVLRQQETAPFGQSYVTDQSYVTEGRGCFHVEAISSWTEVELTPENPDVLR